MMSKLRIALLGFGRTGRLAADEIIKDRTCRLVCVVRRSTKDSGNFASRLLGHGHDSGEIVPMSSATQPEFWSTPERGVDVLIDFSDATAVALYPAVADHGIRIVSAVSHYSPEQYAIVRSAASRTAVMHSANITVGVNFLLVAAQVLRDFAPHADIEVVEEHFRAKKGVSGTALRIANVLGIKRGHIKSIRAGGIVGRHEVIFGMPNQTVRMAHESISRSAFGRGALLAAKWISARPPGMYSMEGIVRESMARTLKTA
jgi:4-hydroxy-tetrahydrodipicolinate reductase